MYLYGGGMFLIPTDLIPAMVDASTASVQSILNLPRTMSPNLYFNKDKYKVMWMLVSACRHLIGNEILSVSEAAGYAFSAFPREPLLF